MTAVASPLALRARSPVRGGKGHCACLPPRRRVSHVRVLFVCKRGAGGRDGGRTCPMPHLVPALPLRTNGSGGCGCLSRVSCSRMNDGGDTCRAPIVRERGGMPLLLAQPPLASQQGWGWCLGLLFGVNGDGVTITRIVFRLTLQQSRGDKWRLEEKWAIFFKDQNTEYKYMTADYILGGRVQGFTCASAYTAGTSKTQGRNTV
ncbi:hypothetical protein EDB84DRAFT_1606731 [Lactarius hengduanensis]|nr:hypothetical protein EDB84DRAFT_1606731 [Lactarius hengduanensis]